MLRSRLSNVKVALCLVAAIAVTLWIAGCQSNGSSSAPQSASAAKSAEPLHATMLPNEKGGAQVWAENCSRCHNIRPPEYYSDAQWAVVVQHMRLRANLTGQEQRKITEFLQASN